MPKFILLTSLVSLDKNFKVSRNVSVDVTFPEFVSKEDEDEDEVKYENPKSYPESHP